MIVDNFGKPVRISAGFVRAVVRDPQTQGEISTYAYGFTMPAPDEIEKPEENRDAGERKP